MFSIYQIFSKANAVFLIYASLAFCCNLFVKNKKDFHGNPVYDTKAFAANNPY